MTRVVVDASVAVKWFLPEELATEARRLLALEYDLLAPDLLWAELGNVLWKKHRRGEFDRVTAARLLGDFSRVPIEFHAAEPWTEAALDLAIRHGVTVYDGPRPSRPGTAAVRHCRPAPPGGLWSRGASRELGG